MSATFSAARLLRILKQRAETSVGALTRRAKRAAKFGSGTWLYANSETTSTSPVEEHEQPRSAHDAVLTKAMLNEQAPVKPVYIAPRNPVVLCHGPEKLPLLQVHYWRGIREALEKIGARVVIAKVPGTGGVRERAHQLDSLLASRLASEKVNILGHSMGGLDARYLISHIHPKSYSVASLTTVCTPHHGSPFMDWCRDYLSLGYRVDPDQLIRDFAAVWKQEGPSAHSASPGIATDNAAFAVQGVPEAILRERISSIINQAVGVQACAGGFASQPSLPNIDPADARLRDFAHFLTGLLSENASAREFSQLSRLERTSVSEGDYLQRSMSLLRMVYRRIMATLDTPAYACLTTDYCNRFFNPATPDDPRVEYLSFGAHIDTNDISDRVNPLIIPHDIIYKAEGPNDGFVSLTSAQWGHYLGSVCADHFDFTNRWRVTSLGRDFISTIAYWGDKWSTWLNRNEGSGSRSANSPANTKAPPCSRPELGDAMLSGSKRFDPIEFYLRVGTILYQRGF
ncbi:hypothetical protein GGI12_003549 [Dipsacomyces acuminosporus]|nr:hypothetical protein GGI12_003549 [Dipsacomyces acuminosporus]